jgi:hypothetical protein
MIMRMRLLCPNAMFTVAVFSTLSPQASRAGVINPDISVVGQPFIRTTDDPADPDRDRLQLNVGETEFVFDAYLNPYARGFFTLALGEEGIELEEGFFSLLRGLPGGVAMKGGQYRVGFGKLNPVHPHAYPFAERFRVLGYLPGEESFGEVGLSLSRRIPVAGDFSLDPSVDWLQGNTFRIEREPVSDLDPLNQGGDDDASLTRPAVLGRLSGFTMVGEQSALEFGVSGTRGTNNVAARAHTTVFGGDVKAKLWTSPQAYLLLQAEGLHLDRDEVEWSDVDGYTLSQVTPSGGYFYADYNFRTRYNFGASYERYQQPTAEEPWDQAFGLFAGLALLEETTAFRLDWNHFVPDEGDEVNTLILRAIYSMGPHKAHQF